MANPYSPSFRPILSNPLASALSGLTSGAMTGYELVNQHRQQQQAEADRQQQLALAGQAQARDNAIAGYTPPGQNAAQAGGVGAALRAAAGVSGIPGVLPATDMASGLPASFQQGGIDFSKSLAGQTQAARAQAASALESQRQAAAMQQILARGQQAHQLLVDRYGNVTTNAATGEMQGNSGVGNAGDIFRAYAAGKMLPLNMRNTQSEIDTRGANLDLNRQRLALAQRLGVISGANTVQKMQRAGSATASTPSEKDIDKLIAPAIVNGIVKPGDVAALKAEMLKAGLYTPNMTDDTTDDDTDPMNLLNDPEDQP